MGVQNVIVIFNSPFISQFASLTSAQYELRVTVILPLLFLSLNQNHNITYSSNLIGTDGREQQEWNRKPKIRLVSSLRNIKLSKNIFEVFSFTQCLTRTSCLESIHNNSHRYYVKSFRETKRGRVCLHVKYHNPQGFYDRLLF